MRQVRIPKWEWVLFSYGWRSHNKKLLTLSKLAREGYSSSLLHLFVSLLILEITDNCGDDDNNNDNYYYYY